MIEKGLQQKGTYKQKYEYRNSFFKKKKKKQGDGSINQFF